jgi:hypothetical protein
VKTLSILALATVATAAVAAYVIRHAVKYGPAALTPVEAAIVARKHARRSLDSELEAILSATAKD